MKQHLLRSAQIISLESKEGLVPNDALFSTCKILLISETSILPYTLVWTSCFVFWCALYVSSSGRLLCIVEVLAACLQVNFIQYFHSQSFVLRYKLHFRIMTSVLIWINHFTWKLIMSMRSALFIELDFLLCYKVAGSVISY